MNYFFYIFLDVALNMIIYHIKKHITKTKIIEITSTYCLILWNFLLYISLTIIQTVSIGKVIKFNIIILNRDAAMMIYPIINKINFIKYVYIIMFYKTPYTMILILIPSIKAVVS